jgi:microcystin-dependent protein
MWDADTFYAVGDLAISPTDFEPYRRIVAGTTATDPAADSTNWIKAADYYTKAETYSKAETDALLVTAVSPGAILYFAMNTAPSGYLKANGALVSRTTYAALFAAIGTTYGEGNGSTTFALPDLRGEFLRSWDDGRFVDAGRVFGSEQGHATAQQTGSADFAGSASNGPRVRNAVGIMSISSGSNFQRNETGATNVTSQRVTVTIGSGSETRPRNVALLACIKF